MLDDAALEAATSRGLLRRARRDLETGAARLTRHEADEAVVQLSDAVVTLRSGGLTQASCTCPAHETCRHVLAAIILLRGTSPLHELEPRAHAQAPAAARAPSPDPVGEIRAYTHAQLGKAFGKALLLRAAESLPAAADVTITISGATCVVALGGRPEVRYVAGLGIKEMLCKAPAEDAKLLRAQALLAVRRAHDPQAVAAAPTLKEPTEAPDIRTLLDRASPLLVDWALAGLAAAPEPLEDRLFDAAIAARAGGLFRLSAELRRLSEDVRRRRERDADLAPLESLRSASRTFALIEALRRSPGDGSLRGQGRDTFDPVGELALRGCGFEIWRTPTDARGATAHFYAPSLRRWFSASLARGSGQDPSFVPEQAVQRESVWGSTLEGLSGSEVGLTGAAATATGRLSLSREIRASLLPLQLEREELAGWEGSFQEWSALDAFIREHFAPALRGTRGATQVAVLLPSRTGRPAFDEVDQELIVPLFDRNGKQLNITIANVPHHERRLLALEDILTSKSPEAFFVTVAVQGEQVELSPYALLASPDGAAISLDSPGRSPSKEKGLRGLAERLRRELAQLRTDRAPPQTLMQTSTGRLLGTALDQLLGLCELGGQMQDPGLIEKISTLARGLEGSGLRPPALLLAAVASASGRQRAHAVLVAAHAVNDLLQLMRLPLG